MFLFLSLGLLFLMSHGLRKESQCKAKDLPVKLNLSLSLSTLKTPTDWTLVFTRLQQQMSLDLTLEISMLQLWTALDHQLGLSCTRILNVIKSRLPGRFLKMMAVVISLATSLKRLTMVQMTGCHALDMPQSVNTLQEA